MKAVILANRPPAPELPNTEALPPPENDAHSFLARLDQDKDNEGYTYDDMQGKNQGLHGGNSSAGWTMPALNRLCQ